MLAAVFAGADEQVRAAGAILAGGHTIRDAEPKYGLAVVGTVHPDGIWPKSGARPGDALFLTKPLGTGLVLAGTARADSASSARSSWMTTLNRAAADVLRPFEPNAVTDVTGFGLFGHAHEMADRSGVRIVLDAAAMPALDGALEAARAGVRTGGDPRNREFAAASRPTASPEELLALGYDAQTAGGLLVTLPADKALSLEAEFARARTSSCAGSAGRVRRRVRGPGPVAVYTRERDSASQALPRRRVARRLAGAIPAPARDRSRPACSSLIVATGATVRLTGSGPRLRALARLPGGRSAAEEGLPLLRRVLEPDRRASRSSRRSCSRSPRRSRAALAPPREGARVARLRRHARAGAARRDHRLLRPQPLARDLAPAALARSCSGSACSSLLEATRLVRGGAPALPALARAAASCCSWPRRVLVVTGTLATAAGPHPGLGDDVPPARLVPARRRRARPRDRRLRDRLPRARGLGVAQPRALSVAPARLRRAARAPRRPDGDRRDPVPEPDCRGGSCSCT